MKRRIGFLAVVFSAVLAVMLLAPVAFAQGASRVTIPFTFIANHQVLPAGSYTVERQSDSYILLVNRSTGKLVGLMARTTNSYKAVSHSSLVFYNTGHRYWLTELRFANINMTSQLATQPAPEPSLARATAKPTVEIAMR